jgi:selenide,water dikinase
MGAAMQSSGWPFTRDLVFIGGGHAAALVLRGWIMDPLPGVRLTVLNPDPVAPYSGMLPGHVAGHYDRGQMMIDLLRLAHAAGARLILAAAEGIDRAAQRIHVAGRPGISYDAGLIDIGIGTAPEALPGFSLHAVAAKPLGPFADAWARFVADAGAGRAAPQVGVLGGGIAGVELALAMRHRLHRAGLAPEVVLIDRGAAMAGVQARTRARLLRACADAAIRVLEHCPPSHVEAGAVVLTDGSVVRASFVLGVAGARPQGWLAETGLALENGFVRVRPSLQTETDPMLFAAGDIAHLVHAPRPKAGVYAVRAAPVLAHNLRALLSGGPMRSYTPQRDYLKLISLGGKRAVADRAGLVAEGDWIWRMKDRIDRRFMAMLQPPPAPPAPPVPARAAHGLAEEMAGPPLCAGCGAKIGPGALRAGLSDLPRTDRPDILRSAGDDAAVLAQGTGGQTGVQVITADHMRMLVADPFVMARIAALHAVGDIWAMGAEVQAGLAQVVLARMSQRLQARDLAEITAALAEVLASAGGALVGGHTTQGAEGLIGLTVTGLAPCALAKSGAMPGDRLVLTRPLGSGIVMAALMAPPRPGTLPADGPLLGEAVAQALAQMQRPGRAAAAILALHARALTDVTGFGLAGHLGEMLGADLSAQLSFDAIARLPLALALARAGVRAHLHAANAAAAPPLVGYGAELYGADSAEAALILDPQTAGGFLAAVPADQAEAVVRALHAAGEGAAALIGTVTPGPAEIRLGP